MTTRKYVGVETEFGITVDGPTELNPVLASSLVVGAYRPSGDRDVRWDHSDEHPLRDARHYDDEAPDTPPAAADDPGMVNTVLTNGARFYVDHAHPEYATPECASARDLLIWDKAGERILEDAAERAGRTLPQGRVVIHKNNTDGKGAAYGTHENYLMPRSVPFSELTEQLLPFFVSRLVFTGAGRLGSELADVDYQLSQRADFFEVEVGLETTLKRPLMNTRDEPHADPAKYRRLHVINADANLCEVATLLKAGTMLLILDMIEDGAMPDVPALADPVGAFQQVSHDLTLRAPLECSNGETTTTLKLQGQFLEAAKRYVKDAGRDDVDTAEILERWEAVLTQAEDDPRKLSGQVDWATKLELLENYRARHDLAWDHPRLEMVALQYHDVRRDKGLYNRLAARGRVERLISDEEVESAMHSPPVDTRAWFRGECIRRFGDQITAAGWDSLVFDVGEGSLQRVPMMEPGRGTESQLGSLLARCDTATQLLHEITS